MITCRLRDAVLMLRRLTSQEARAEEKASIRTKQDELNKIDEEIKQLQESVEQEKKQLTGQKY